MLQIKTEQLERLSNHDIKYNNLKPTQCQISRCKSEATWRTEISAEIFTLCDKHQKKELDPILKKLKAWEKP